MIAQVGRFAHSLFFSYVINMAEQRETNKTKTWKQTGIRCTSTISITNESSDQDNFDMLIRKIAEREKENQQTVTMLQEMIKKERRKCIAMKFTLERREEETGNLARENEEFDSGLKQALNDLKDAIEKAKKLKPLKSTISDEKRKGKINDEGDDEEETNFEPNIRRLRNILKDLKEEVAKKEECLKDNAPKGEAPRDKETQDSSPSDEKLNRLRDKLNDLKNQRKQWIHNVMNLLREEDDSTEITTFKKAIAMIIKFADSLAALENDYNELKKKLERLAEKKKKLHEALSKRLEARNALNYLPNKVRREFEIIAKKSGNAARLPDAKQDLVAHLTDLYEWGRNEFFKGENYLKQLSTQRKNDVDAADRKKNLRNSQRQSIDDEIEKDADRLKKLQDANEKLRVRAEKAKERTEESNKKAIEICMEIRGAIDVNKSRTIEHENLKTEIEDEINKRRQTEDAVDQLGRTKAHQDDDLKRLDDQIRDQKRRMEDLRKPNNGNQSAKTLESLKRQNAILAERIREKPRTQQQIAPSKLSTDAQKRRIDKLNKLLKEKADKLKDFERDCDELRRQMKKLENDLLGLKVESKRKKDRNDEMDGRIKQRLKNLNELKNEQKEFQEKCRTMVKKQSEQCTTGQMSFFHRNETRFASNQSSLQKCTFVNESDNDRQRESFYSGQNQSKDLKEIEWRQTDNEAETKPSGNENKTRGKRQNQNYDNVIKELRSEINKLGHIVENLDAKMESRPATDGRSRMTTMSSDGRTDDDSQTSSNQNSSFKPNDPLVIDFYMPAQSLGSSDKSRATSDAQSKSNDDEVSLLEIEKFE